MATTRDSKGKFVKKQSNPDCEVATRGYVKYVMRKERGHTHTQTACGVAWFLAALIGWSVTLIVGVASSHYLLSSLSQHTIPLALFSIICSIGFYETLEVLNESTSEVSGDIPKYLIKYEPRCDHMEECK